jgi:hypothetical protein
VGAEVLGLRGNGVKKNAEKSRRLDQFFACEPPKSGLTAPDRAEIPISAWCPQRAARCLRPIAEMLPPHTQGVPAGKQQIHIRAAVLTLTNKSSA